MNRIMLVNLDHEKIPVKLVGGGRDKDYGYLGFSHWAEEDEEIMAVLKNIKSHRPKEDKEIKALLIQMINHQGPDYINLKR